MGAQAAEILARFRREAQAAGRLTHPNIVGDLRLRRGRRRLVHRDGARQRARAQGLLRAERAVRDGDIVRILSQILAALGYSHKLGVVHRDIKPSNMFLLADGIGEGRGLRHRAHRLVGAHAGRHGARHARVHVARADPGLAGGRPLRSFLRRRDPLPVPHRRAAVHRQRDDHDAQGAGGGAAAAVALQHADSRRDGCRRAPGAGQEARRALSDRRGIRAGASMPRRMRRREHSGETTMVPPSRRWPAVAAPASTPARPQRAAATAAQIASGSARGRWRRASSSRSALASGSRCRAARCAPTSAGAGHDDARPTVAPRRSAGGDAESRCRSGRRCRAAAENRSPARS